MSLHVNECPETADIVRVQIGHTWVEHNFGRQVDMATARDRAIQILDSLTTANPSPEAPGVDGRGG